MATLTACPRCRTVVPPGHANCLRCGHAVDAPIRRCAACQHRNGADSRFCARCGRGLNDPAAALPAPPVDAAATKVLLDAGPRPRAFLVTLAVLVALCVVVAGLKVVDHEFYSPTRTVKSFFDALASRDASAARRLLTSADSEAPLLQSSVLRNGGYSPPGEVRVEHADIADGSASVRVSFALSGARQTAEIALRRDDHATAGLFHRWHIDGGVNELDIAAADVPAVEVAGALITFGEDAESTRPTAFPGGYQVNLPEQPLWTAQPVTALVGLDDSGAPVTLDPRIKDTARTAVEQQVRAYVDECAKTNAPSPPNCPFSTSSYDQVSNVRWKVVSYPEFELNRDYSGRLIVSTTVPGEADVSGTAVPYYGGSSYSYRDDVTFGVSGPVVLSGTDVTFQPDQQ
jgi:hypothetical protein